MANRFGNLIGYRTCISSSRHKPGFGLARVVALVALIPTTTAILIYYFIGNFIGGHVHLAAALLSFAALS